MRACTLISSAYGRKRKGVKCAKSLYILLSILNVYKADSRHVVRNIPSFFLGIAVLASDFISLILNNYLLYRCSCFIIENEFNFFWILSSPSSPWLIYEGVDRLTTVSRADYSGKSHRIIYWCKDNSKTPVKTTKNNIQCSLVRQQPNTSRRSRHTLCRRQNQKNLYELPERS